MQRTVGNATVSDLVAQRQPKTDVKPAKADEQRLSALRTIALEAVDVYHTAAAAGIADAVSTVGNPGWRPFGLALAGNLIWAAACFSTGGTAFAISLAGIGVGAVGAIPASEPEFKKWADDVLVGEVVKRAKDQVDPVTRDVASRIPAEGWDDNKVRHDILSSMFRPEYLETIGGGIPNISRTAIQHRVDVDVLVRANRQTVEPRPLQNPGFVRYVYSVNGHNPKGRDWYYGDKLAPVTDWRFAFKEATLALDKGGDAALAEVKKDPEIAPAGMPLVKLVVLSGAEGEVVLVLNGDNSFFERRTTSPVFYQVDGPAVLAQVWKATAGAPPPIRTSSLT